MQVAVRRVKLASAVTVAVARSHHPLYTTCQASLLRFDVQQSASLSHVHPESVGPVPGATENARKRKYGTIKMQGVENVGKENAAQNCRGGKCRKGFSTPAIICRIFFSCIFHPCSLVPHFLSHAFSSTEILCRIFFSRNFHPCNLVRHFFSCIFRPCDLVLHFPFTHFLFLAF